MLRLGLCETFNNMKRTVLMTLLITILSLMAVIAITSYETQSKRYRPFRDLLDGEGYTGAISLPNANSYGGIDNLINNCMKGVRDYEYLMREDIVLDEFDGKQLRVTGISKRLASYRPAMADGKWISKTAGSGEMEAVVTQNSYGIKTGDYIEYTDYEGNERRIHICGMLDNGASVFSFQGRLSVGMTIFDFYRTFDMKQNDNDIELFMLKEEMQKWNIGYFNNLVIIKFKDDLSEEDRKANNKYLSLPFSALMLRNSELREGTERIIRNKVLSIIPVLIAIFILVSFGVASLAALDTSRHLKQYAIYFCCGMRWYQCALINMVETLVSGVAGLCIMVISGNVLKAVFGKNLILFTLGKNQILACLGIVVYLMILSIVFPLFIIRDRQPKDVLREKG